jgi:hypothetical protein
MHGHRRWTAAVMLLVSWVTLATLHGHDNGGKVKTLGLIKGRAGDTLRVKTIEGNINSCSYG